MNNRFRFIVLFTMLCALSATATADAFYDTYQRGLAAFKARDYANARSEFLRAYDLRPEPVILFNVAQTYRLELSSEQALVYYKRFLAESKIAEDLRDEAQGYVAALQVEQKAREAKTKIEANDGPKERDGTPVKVTMPPMDRHRPPSSTTASSAAPVDALRDARDDGRARNSTRVLTIAVAGAGVVLLGGAVGFGLSGSSSYNSARNELMDQARRDSLYSDANTKRHVALGMAVSGLACGGVAAWLYFTGRAAENRSPSVNSARVDVVPVVGAAMGLAIMGGF